MAVSKTQSVSGSKRADAKRQHVLDAAEGLLRDGKADFSMRDLASRAEVSFATPFNQFGSKAAIMHALSARRIAAMRTRLSEAPADLGAGERVLLAVDTAVAVMLEAPAVNRTVMGWLGAAGPVAGDVWTHSAALWKQALGAGAGLSITGQPEALSRLAGHLAFGFRGVLSFWTAGEMSDDTLRLHARETAEALLKGLH
ncbi:short chain dehydrogenase [Acetobacter nitrogenifigens DSM 23921 = NBRC 105050]|uniref:HTH tetR-type domain-containing protein n=1 Tax=Acetobacter nitrogenifigens DSM 23921 = NBRC 105050 TaxID=1120919 RepID=A0A511X6B7_9PROT|nr:TetR family transcriptional regulator [Acetobacter nitrogenifigens]GBQ92530.1 short chain dehydrogenase [Acetobacter nitrogenifigens DSM 23921 = NBRC 105050]GEN58498.1 hypothetical protein ANI02nite_03820 [Acetobacter nitrogenifigens DSM 23921 = NBRC 105050]